MKRPILILLLLYCCAASLCAQSGLQINALFDGRYHNNPDATEVLLKGKRISAYNLKLFRSLTLASSGAEASRVERLVKADAARAVYKEARHKSGRLYYGFYCLEPAGGLNRYLFYRNNGLQAGGQPTLTLIYMEGKATMSELKKRFGK